MVSSTVASKKIIHCRTNKSFLFILQSHVERKITTYTLIFHFLWSPLLIFFIYEKIVEAKRLKIWKEIYQNKIHIDFTPFLYIILTKHLDKDSAHNTVLWLLKWMEVINYLPFTSTSWIFTNQFQLMLLLFLKIHLAFTPHWRVYCKRRSNRKEN